MDNELLGVVCLSLAILFFLISISIGVDLEAENSGSEVNHGETNGKGNFFCFLVIIFTAFGLLSIIVEMRGVELPLEERARYKGWPIVNRDWKYYPDGISGERILENDPLNEPTLDTLNESIDEMKRGKGL
jgi:hypothetical protein